MIRAKNERQVRELGRREPERLVEKNLPRRVRQVIFTPDHMRHFHQRVVHDDGEVVCGGAVGAQDDGIADDIGLEPHLAADRVLEDDVAAVRYTKANGGMLAGSDSHLHLVVREVTAGARILHRTPVLDGRLPVRFELRRRAEAVVGGPGAEELLGVRLIEVQPVGLPIRSARPAHVGPLVPIETEPPEVADNRRLRLAGRAFGVRVLEPEDEDAVGSARKQPVEQRGARVADVELAGRARGESDSHGVWRA